MEYENALIPMTFSHYIMHNKNFYIQQLQGQKVCVLLLVKKRPLKALVKNRGNY